jgi:hypothetical protein
MFAIIRNNEIYKLVQEGTAFELDENQYPVNWCNLSTSEEKTSIGMVDVVYAQRPDDKYYWVTENPPVYLGGVVEVSFTTTAKDLTQLKASATQQINQTAWNILSASDWMVTKSVETETPMNAEWSTWRAAIRTQASTGLDAIEACTTVEDLAALPSIDWEKDPDQVLLEEDPDQVLLEE